MDFNLREHEKMLQRGAKDFANAEIRPKAEEIDIKCEFPFDIVSKMGQMGYFGLPYPADYGGSGAGYTGFALVTEQLSRASMVTGAIMGVMSLTGEALFRHGSEGQRQTHLMSLASGALISSFAFTEAATGSDPSSIQTRAVPDGDDYIINGQKHFIALSPASKMCLVFAMDETDMLSAFLVDTSSPGYQIRHSCATMGARGFCPCVIYMDDVRVPAKNIVGEKSNGYDILLESVSVGKLAISAESVGVAQEAFDLSIAYARERTAYDKPISNLPSIKGLLADMYSRIEAARLLTYKTASLRDEGKSILKASATSKLFCSQTVVDVTRMAMQVHGAYGYMADMPIERLYRDAKLTEIYEGVSEIQRVIIANHLLKEQG
jgi:alkylation response protein AidB-like acyl-CoA dehydrogenase